MLKAIILLATAILSIELYLYMHSVYTHTTKKDLEYKACLGKPYYTELECSVLTE